MEISEENYEKVEKLLNDFFNCLEQASGIVEGDNSITYSPIEAGRSIERIDNISRDFMKCLNFKFENGRVVRY